MSRETHIIILLWVLLAVTWLAVWVGFDHITRLEKRVKMLENIHPGVEHTVARPESIAEDILREMYDGHSHTLKEPQ